MPHAFYGALEINGQPAPVGTTVEARGAGVITGDSQNPVITTEVGRYGSQHPLIGLRLLVRSELLHDGDIIEFYINGLKADQTYPFTSGEITALKLTFSTTKYSLNTGINPAGSGTVNLNPVQPVDGYSAGMVVTVIGTANAGYIFSSWSGDLTGSTNPTTVTMNSNKNVTANFTLTTTKFTLTFSASPGAGGAVNLNPAQPVDGYSAGTVVTVTAAANAGYIFTGWSGDLTGSVNPATITMNSNKNITANFTLTTTKYTLTVSANPVLGGVVNLNPAQPVGGYDSGTVVTLSTSANTGHTFSSWSGDLTGNTNPTTITMNSNKNIIANFTEVVQGTVTGSWGAPSLPSRYTINISINPLGGGTISIVPTLPPDGFINGTMATVTASPKTGYIFSGWSGDLTGNANPATLMMNSNKNITASFAAAKYTLTVTIKPAEGGKVNLNPPQPADGYAAGTSVTLAATASAGFTFTGWSGDLTGNTNPATLTMNSKKNITANFTTGLPAAKYALAVTINPAEGGKVNLNPPQPADGYPAGTVVTLIANANSGYTFESFTGDLAGKTNPATITMDSKKNVAVNFVASVPIQAKLPIINWQIMQIIGIVAGVAILGIVIFRLYRFGHRYQ